jgi:repressor of nif and glnA expression
MIDEMHLGMVSMHILHHGQDEKIEPGWMAEELDEHGYSYDEDEVERAMRNLVAKGLMETDEDVYWTTDRGTEFLSDMKAKGQELSHEVLQS